MTRSELRILDRDHLDDPGAREREELRERIRCWRGIENTADLERRLDRLEALATGEIKPDPTPAELYERELRSKRAQNRIARATGERIPFPRIPLDDEDL